MGLQPTAALPAGTGTRRSTGWSARRTAFAAIALACLLLASACLPATLAEEAVEVTSASGGQAPVASAAVGADGAVGTGGADSDVQVGGDEVAAGKTTKSNKKKSKKKKKKKSKGKKKGRKSKKTKKGRKAKAEEPEVEIDEDGAMEAFNKGTGYYGRSKVKAAEKYFRKAIGLNPKLVQAHVNLGLIAMNFRRDHEAAAAHFLAGIDLSPHDPATPRAFNYLGVARKAQGRVVDAEKAYRNAILRNWTLTAAHYNLGILLLDVDGRDKEALEAFQNALKANPGHADTLATLGRYYRDQGKPKSAFRYLRRALKHDAEHREAAWQLARLLEARGQMTEVLFNAGANPSKPGAEARSRWDDDDDDDDDDEDDEDLWQQRRGDKVVPGDAGVDEVLVLSYMTKATVNKHEFGYCRMLSSAAHNRIELEVLGKKDKWQGNAGAKLAAVLDRLRGEPRETVVMFVDADMAVFLDSPDVLLDKYLGFGDGNAWVFGADCNCFPYLLFDNATCSQFPKPPTPYGFLHGGAWMARAGTVVDLLTDVEQNTAKYFANANVAKPGLKDVKSDSHVFADYFVSGLVPEMVIDYDGELIQAFTRPVYPAAPEGGYSAPGAPAAVRRHTGAAELSRCNPFADVKDGDAVDVIRNTRTGAEPSVLHLSRSTGGEVYNNMAEHFWFNRRAPAPGVPLPGRQLPRNGELHSYMYMWGGKLATFTDVEMCPELFREVA